MIAEPLTVIADTLTDPIIGKALDGTIHSWSAGAEELYGYRAEEVVGKPISILAPPERVGEVEDILERVSRGESIRQFETVRRRKDGSDVDVSLSITPVRNPSAEIVGASAVAQDISERKRRKEVQSFLAEPGCSPSTSTTTRRSPSRLSTLLRIADGCIVEVVDAAGMLTQVAIAHRMPDKVELMREMRRLDPPEADSGALVSRVLRTGKAELITDVWTGF